MKPVIKKQTHYSMLLMRDDTSVRTLRVRGYIIVVFLVFLLLVFVGGGVGIWGGMHYWKKYDALSERHKQQERELGEARVQLERYVNYDTLLEASNGTAAPLAKNEEIGATAPAPRMQNATQASQAAFPPAQPLKAGLNATLAQSNSTVLAPAVTTAEQTPKAPPVPLISSGPLRVNGFSGRIASPQRLRIRYELSTVPSDEQRTISGTAKYFAVFASGAEVELPVQEAGDARFSISRMKLMDANLRLPQGAVAKDITQLYVSLELDEGKAYREAFPISR